MDQLKQFELFLKFQEFQKCQNPGVGADTTSETQPLLTSQSTVISLDNDNSRNDDCVINGPIMENVHDALTLGEAQSILQNPKNWIEDFSKMYKAKSGTVWLYKSKDNFHDEDWRHAGHHFRQTGGAPKTQSNRFEDMVRKVSHIVTKEKPLGDKRFRRITWTSKNRPLFTLVQFSGMEELSVPIINPW